MKRRNFLTAVVALVSTPFVLLRGKAPAEAAVVAGDRPAGPPLESTPSKPSPWYDKRLAEKYYSPARHDEFVQEYMQTWEYGTPMMATNTADRVLVRVDHTILRWHNRKDQQQHSRAPWIILEHVADRDKAGIGKLVIDQPMPCCQCRYDADAGKLVNQMAHEPHMERVLELQLSDPYQLLLADLLVRGLINAGVIENEPFVASWNQVIIDCQNYQFTRKDGDPDAPVEFVQEPLMYEFHAIHGPSKRPEGVSRVRSRDGHPAAVRKLAEHHEAVDYLRKAALRTPG